VELAKGERTRIIQDDLSPAFQRALRVLRRQATDYTESDGVADIDRQKYLALRPRLHERAVNQHSALRWAFGDGRHDPIQSREEAIEWLDKVAATCPDSKNDEWVQQSISPLGDWWSSLTSDRGAWLESQLAAKVLPAMNVSLRQAALEGSEMPQKATEDDGVPTG